MIAPVPAALPTRRSHGRYDPVPEPTGDDWPAVACFSARSARHYRALGWPELKIAPHRANSLRWITLAPGVRVFTRPI